MRLKTSSPPRPPGSTGSTAPGRESPAAPPAAKTAAPADPPLPTDASRAAVDRRLLEILSPLNAIVGFSSLLADVGHGLSPETRHRYAVRVRDAGEALQRMISVLVQSLEGRALDLSKDWVNSGTFLVAPESKGAPDSSTDLAALCAVRGDDDLVRGTGPRPRVFIVDADESNRELFAEFLGGRGYDLVQVGSVDEALREAKQQPPDLVLIDPLLGREDGFVLARTLKASNTRGFVPLVFVTALVDDDSRMRALDAGAEQIVRKPINRHELRARVKTLLQLRVQQEELSMQNAQLKSLQRFKDETTAMLVHDLKSPLSAMMMNLDFALDDLPKSAEGGDVRAALTESRAAGAKLFRMIANLLDIARSDDGRLQPKRAAVDVQALFARVIEEHGTEAQARKVAVTSKVTLTRPIDVDPDIMGRVLANLVENALRYTYAGGSIILAARPVNEGAAVELTVANDGRPIAPESRAFIFEKYGQVASTQSINRGLGLYFCRVAVEAHGGRIDLVNDSQIATCFRIELPQT
jgi:signal transduction histidine kinase